MQHTGRTKLSGNLVDNKEDISVRLTLLEERQSQNARSLERAFNKVDVLEKKLQDITTSQAISNTKVGFSERLFWMLVSPIVGLVGYLISHMKE